MRVERPRYVKVCRVEFARRLMSRVPNLPDLVLRCQTLPTEFMLTALTLHMITPRDLLYSPAAARAWTLLRHSVECGLICSFLVASLLPAGAVSELLARFISVPLDLMLQTLLVSATRAVHIIVVLRVQLSTIAA